MIRVSCLSLCIPLFSPSLCINLYLPHNHTPSLSLSLTHTHILFHHLHLSFYCSYLNLIYIACSLLCLSCPRPFAVSLTLVHPTLVPPIYQSICESLGEECHIISPRKTLLPRTQSKHRAHISGEQRKDGRRAEKGEERERGTSAKAQIEKTKRKGYRQEVGCRRRRRGYNEY